MILMILMIMMAIMMLFIYCKGHNTSSWGGAVLKGPDGTYHMWAAEMTEHCGIGTWQQNSRLIHATSTDPGE